MKNELLLGSTRQVSEQAWGLGHEWGREDDGQSLISLISAICHNNVKLQARGLKKSIDCISIANEGRRSRVMKSKREKEETGKEGPI